MVSLLTDFNITTILIILLVGIPAIVNFIKWVKGLWATREQFKQENIQKGKELEACAEAQEAEKMRTQSQIKELQDNVTRLTTMLENQEKMIELLIASDELSIKAWIKEQHETWMPLGCIDSQTFELLEARYKIYVDEGGNSWAKKLMDDLRDLPVVTVIPLHDVHHEQ